MLLMVCNQRYPTKCELKKVWKNEIVEWTAAVKYNIFLARAMYAFD